MSAAAVRARRERTLTAAACALGALLLYAAWRRYVEFDVQEAFGFVTGAACVWLGVKQNIWNWPIGIANNLVYVAIFVHARLFADAGLQVAFAALGAYGWFMWARRGSADAGLAVSRTPAATWAVTAVAVAAATAGLAGYLAQVNDAAPFLDALTTTLSLAAQYLQTRKYLECWLLWIAVDLISIGLYAVKGLELTAVLYAAFLAMCVAGFVGWRAPTAAAGSSR